MGKNFALLQLWLFWFLTSSICSPGKIITSHPNKNPEMIETVQPRDPKIPAGSNQATPSKKKGKHLQVSSNRLGLFGVQLLRFQTCVWSTYYIHFNRIIDKPPNANQKRSPTQKTSQNAQKKWKNHLANQGLFGPWSPPPTPPFVLHYVVVLQGHAMPKALRLDILDEWMNG